jgi:hypothetical protein
LASFYKVAHTIGHLFIHNDSTLNDQDRKILKRLFPSAVIMESDSVGALVGQLEGYPSIQNCWVKYGHRFQVKKLICPFIVGNNKYSLFIDGDILWFRRPEMIEEEIKNGCSRSLMASSCLPNYVYFKDGSRVSEESALYNSGIVLYNKGNFNLSKLSVFIESIDLGRTYFIDQGGYVACLENLKKLPPEDYSIDMKVGNNTVARHYTRPRRHLFYTEGMSILRRGANLC